MKKKLIIGSFILLLIIILIFIITRDKKYKYICLNMDLSAEEIIDETKLTECTTKDTLPDGALTKKEQLLFHNYHKKYMLKEGVSIKKGDILYKDYFDYYEDPKQTSTELQLLDELEVMNHGNSSDEFVKYRVYIKDNKLYATNKTTNETKIVFDAEEVKKIASRPICCTGNAYLLILTNDGNVYISEKDSNYFFSFDFPFNKIDATDIVSFKLIPYNDYDSAKNLYGVNSKGEEILLQNLFNK